MVRGSTRITVWPSWLENREEERLIYPMMEAVKAMPCRPALSGGAQQQEGLTPTVGYKVCTQTYLITDITHKSSQAFTLVVSLCLLFSGFCGLIIYLSKRKIISPIRLGSWRYMQLQLLSIPSSSENPLDLIP
jgi:hypothetical protein